MCGLARSVGGAGQVVGWLVEGVAVSVEGEASSVWCAVGLVAVCAVGEVFGRQGALLVICLIII